MGAIGAKTADLLTATIDVARRQPGRVLAAVLAAHLVIWTLLPIPLSPNLQLDLAEALALGKEWQIGYWKHPPLPWWAADLIYQITGTIYSVYLLGPLAVVICMLGVYFLARDIVGPVQALIPVLALEGIHYYNFSAVKFAHDQMQLPIWAWAGFFLYRALVRGQALYWIGAGAMVALAFWTKYSAFVFGLSLALFLLLDPSARRAWRTPGPYLMALAFGVVIAPHVAWLLDHLTQSPLIYAELRARQAERWYQFITFPLRWIGGQFFFVLPALVMLGFAYGPRPIVQQADGALAFARRYVTMLAFGPFLIVTMASILGGRLAVLLWGYPLWSFLPLAATVWFGPVVDTARLKAFAAACAVIFVAMPVLYWAVPVIEPLFRERTMAIHFPGRMAADILTRTWHEKTGSPLVYVTGDEHAANSIAVYSPDRPHVIVYGILQGPSARSPWAQLADVKRRGALVVWEEGAGGESFFPAWRANLPGFDENASSVLELPLLSRHPRIIRLRYVMIPPRE
ncbi:MAG: glycosyltransferase family 39 protein [Pseudorhodoplanes sp.]|jgi:hypothetical protein|nr:glycosyltransferase family 39 protein [Pseudorhodoplanes sp.]